MDPELPAPSDEPWNYSLVAFVLAYDEAPPPAPPQDPSPSSGAPAAPAVPSSSQAEERQRDPRNRWTPLEHARFVKALRAYQSTTSTSETSDGGRGAVLGPGVARKIAEYVKTRTESQVRSHAQKYFRQLQKDREEGRPAGRGQDGAGES